MIFVWSRPLPPIVTVWRGLDDQTRATLELPLPKSIAAVVGPRGERGPAGQDGAAQLPPVIDGGNF